MRGTCCIRQSARKGTQLLTPEYRDDLVCGHSKVVDVYNTFPASRSRYERVVYSVFVLLEEAFCTIRTAAAAARPLAFTAWTSLTGHSIKLSNVISSEAADQFCQTAGRGVAAGHDQSYLAYVWRNPRLELQDFANKFS